jgi:KRAB domain-containing zinc finger protein
LDKKLKIFFQLDSEGEQKMNTVEKTNKCIQCDFESADARNLRTHMKTHSGEKPYKCGHCDYASSHAGNVKKT